jgi:hypothetical protein
LTSSGSANAAVLPLPVLGLGDEVAAGQRQGQAGGLDRRHRQVAQLLQSGLQVRRQGQGVERVAGGVVQATTAADLQGGACLDAADAGLLVGLAAVAHGHFLAKARLGFSGWGVACCCCGSRTHQGGGDSQQGAAKES